MKKYLIIICMLLQIVAAKADPVEIDGLKYDLNIDEKTASVSSGNSYNGILVIPEAVTYQNVKYTVTSISENAFYWTDLLSVTIPNSVKIIGISAFSYNSNLASVKIGDGVENIESGAFRACTNLNSVTLGKNVRFIGKNAFYGNINMNQVYISDLTAWCQIDFESIEANPLYHSHHLYLNKKEIKDLVIPKEITKIKDYTFAGGQNINSLTIGENIETIGAYSFYQCTSISSVDFSASTNTINDFSFYECTSLETIQLPDNIENIGEYSFFGCSKLENLKLPEDLKNIKYSAFQNCNNLKNIIIPSKVEYINYYAFYNTTENHLAIIMMPEYPPMAFSNSFPNNTKLYVPDESIEPYQNVAPWNNMELATFSSSGPEKCAKPEIIYKNDKIFFNCETPDVEFHYTITTKDFANRQKGKETIVSAIYQVSVYATKEGYENSDLVTSEINIKGIKGDLTGDGIVNVADHVELSNIIMTQQENGTDN